MFISKYIDAFLISADCFYFQTVMPSKKQPWLLTVNSDRITFDGKLRGDDWGNMRSLCNVLYGPLLPGGL